MDTILLEAGLLVESSKATEQMKQSIVRFASLLTCPLCDKIFDRPATLSACAHTFCMKCIDVYSANHCECPAEGCGMPLSIVGGNGGSFRKLNLQISQTIESLQLICKSLNESKGNWWLSPSVLRSIEDMRASKRKHNLPTDEDKGNDLVEEDCHVRNEDYHDDEEDMIDLQANEEDQSCVQSDDDGNISDDESL